MNHTVNARLGVVLVVCDVCHRLLSVSAGPFPLAHDPLDYWLLGQQMAAGDWWLTNPPTAFRTPLFPGYLAVCQMLFDDYALQIAVLGQHGMGIATSVLTGWCCHRLLNRRGTFLIGYGLSALSVGRVQYDNLLLSEPMFTLLLIAHLAAVIRWHERRDVLSAALMGGTLAAGLLVRPITLFLAAFGVFGLIRVNRSERSVATKAKQSTVFLLACLVPLMPWLARNQIVYGQTFLTKSAGIRVWACCFSEHGAAMRLPANALRVLPHDINMRHEWSVNAALAATGMDEPERDRWMQARCWDAIRSQPVLYASSAIRGTLGHWTAIEEALPWYDRGSQFVLNPFRGQRVIHLPEIHRPFDPLLRFTYRYSPAWFGITSGISLLGAILLFRRPDLCWVGLFLLLTLVSFSIMTGFLIYPLYRFRAVTEPLMVVAAVVGWGTLLPRRHSGLESAA